MTHEQRERAIVRNMQALGITRKEAEDLVDDDEAVDRGESLPWDLTPEQMKQARKYANASTRKSGGAVNRTKKENPVKQAVISKVAEALAGYDNVSVTNPERVVDFEVDGVRYSLTLTAHRK